MPFPLIAAGLAIIVGGSCAAWYFNEQTEEEKRSQARERKHQDARRAEYEHESAAMEAQRLEKIRDLAKSQLAASRKIINEYRHKEQEIAEGIAELYRVFRLEMVADSTSPARKIVLRREYCRIEDANARLQQYVRYLDAERKTLESLFNGGHYEGLLDRELPQPLLPVEWLYPGKLVLVGMHEIGLTLPKFNHKLTFGKFRNEQQAIALECGDEFPILVTGQHEEVPSLFFGCAARGRLYYEHIRPCIPATMEVVRSGKSVRCQMFGGLIRAELPRLGMIHPQLSCLPGQRVQVYPELYDLCLRKNPFSPVDSLIQVSEYPPAELGAPDCRELYIEIRDLDLSDITDHHFFSNKSNWSLLNHDPETGAIVLGKSTVRVECRADNQSGILIVDQIVQCSVPQSGYDTGFQFVLFSDQLHVRELVGWPEGVNEFMRVALQFALGKEHSAARVAQAEFLRRWLRVVDYQISAENCAAVEFYAKISRKEDDWRKELLVPLACLKAQIGDQPSALELFQRAYADDKHRPTFPERCFRIERWDSARGAFLPVMSEFSRTRAQYNLEEDNLVVLADFFPILSDGETRHFRFLIRIPSAPLDRQRDALDDFFNEKIVSSEIKEILLAPGNYIPPVGGAEKVKLRLSGKLNESQRQAVLLALSRNRLTLIQGPPGTGKTTVIVELIRQLLHQNPQIKVLIVSQQNAAVDNAISRYLRALKKTGENEPGIVRIGDPDKVDNELTNVRLDIVQQRFKLSLQSAAQQVYQQGDNNESALAAHWLGYLATGDQGGYGPHHEELFVSLLADKQLVGATCVGLASRKAGLDRLQFDVVIIDEAGRSTVPELLIPMLRADKVVLIGDHYQLPPSIAPLLREDSAKEELNFLRETFLETSYFERLYEELPAGCKTILNEQFRMPPMVGELVADLFYNRDGTRMIRNGESVYDRSEDILQESLYWVNVQGRHQCPSGSNSLENKAEADAILRFLKWLSEVTQEETEVAVITPYGAQKRRIRSMLRESAGLDNTYRLNTLLIKVDTVDSFQGSEADVVCYSPVRTAPPLQFVLDRKRLNVACSRAKKHLLFFGHSEFLRAWKPKKGEQNLFAKIIERAPQKEIHTRQGYTWSLHEVKHQRRGRVTPGRSE